MTLTFQRAASDVCHQAKLDYDEWPLQAHELVTHLEERWREGVENGLSTEAAEDRALKLFGDRSQVARALRKPWYRRVLIDQRYRPERYFIFLAAYVFYAWLAIVDVHFRPVYETRTVPDIDRFEEIMLPFHWAFWKNGLGTFLMGLAGIGAVVVVQWNPAFRRAWLNTFLEARKSLKLVALLVAGGLSTMPSYFTYITLAHYENNFLYFGFCVLHVAAVLGGWFGSACLLSEALGIPARMKQRQAQRRPFGIVS